MSERGSEHVNGRDRGRGNASDGLAQSSRQPLSRALQLLLREVFSNLLRQLVDKRGEVVSGQTEGFPWRLWESLGE